jgi:GDSL-like Lipase/Acylhydrolase family
MQLSVGRAVRRCALACVALAFGAGVLEAGLRVLFPDMQILKRDTQLGVFNQSNLDGRAAFAFERTVRVRTNSLGLRGRAIGAKTKSSYRVLALGDSFTFGDTVDETETWPSQLAERLMSDTRPVEVINAGVRGFGTGQELLLYRRLAARVTPDIAVLGFAVVNDPLDNLCLQASSLRPDPLMPCFDFAKGTLTVTAPAPPEPPHAADVGSYLFGFLNLRVRAFAVSNPRLVRSIRNAGATVRLPYMPSTISAWYDARFSDHAWQLTRALLTEMAGELRHDGVPLVILVMPSSLQVDRQRIDAVRVFEAEQPLIRAFTRDVAKPQRLLQEFCASAGLDCVDALPAFLAAEARKERTFYEIDGHWTPAGHRVAAELLAQHMTSRGQPVISTSR